MSGLVDWSIAAAGEIAVGGVMWSWQALVLLAAVALVMKICRAKSPALPPELMVMLAATSLASASIASSCTPLQPAGTQSAPLMATWTAP